MATLTVGTNSYVTLAEAETYLADRLYVNAKWSGAGVSDDDKRKALIMAARHMNTLTWRGRKNVDNQKLAWPRKQTYILGVEDNTVPEDIKCAQIEYAHVIISENTTQVDSNSGKIKKVKAGSVEVEYESDNVTESHNPYEYVDTSLRLYISAGLLVSRA